MNISRRSFLKLAALSTAAVAVSASMTGCANASFSARTFLSFCRRRQPLTASMLLPAKPET